MATFRIHEDQENRSIPEMRHKQANMAPIQQKRAVLGALQNQPDRQNLAKGKQPFGSNSHPAGAEHVSSKQVQKPPPPLVPVAQFEAFKVYEDPKENEPPMRLQHGKLKEPVKGVQGKPLNSKKEWFAQEAKVKQEQKRKQPLDVVRKQQEDWRKEVEDEATLPKSVADGSPMSVEKPTEETEADGSPMSVEKPTEETEKNKTLIVRGGKLSNDRFFEMEEYRTEIFTYLRELEVHNRPKPGYMRKQPDITYNMRTILVDWLVEVAQEYKLHSETLFLAINYIDRFLSYMSVVRGKLQLVGTAAMFIAAKYEEILPPEVGEFVYITDDTYTKKQVIRMEHLILKVLSFDLSVPTPLTFITAMSIASNLPDKAMYLAMYLSELAMLETDAYLETLPSVLAGAAIAIARYTLKLEPWPVELKRRTGYDIKDLKKTMEFVYLLFCKAPTQTHQAIQEKFNSSKYMHVSKLHPRSEDIKLE